MNASRRRIDDRLEEGLERALDRTSDRVDRAAEAVADKIAEVKPRLRGWMHTVSVPLLTAAFAVLIVLSPNAATRVGSSVFAASAILLFTVSGIYHRGNWSPRIWAFWRRFDHANIFVLIAGTYTPFAMLFLHGTPRWVLLGVVWGFAVTGMCFRIFWTDAPRWLYVPTYIVLGWSAVFFVPQLIDGASRFSTAVTVSTLVLVAAGGILYTVGGVVYGLKRPDPFPAWFGFHEIFHTFTVAAFVCHYVAASIATYSLR